MSTSNEHTSKREVQATRLLYSITPFTLLDFPDRTACIFWFAGCNMRCGYCYNPEIVEGKGKLSHLDALQFLEKRMGLLDGVVMSGGECTLHSGLPPLADQVKKMGFQVKLDTNGSRPQVLRELLDGGLVDYVALDFKALPGNFGKVTRSGFFPEFRDSLEILVRSGVVFEVRTTVHSMLFTAADLEDMRDFLRDNGYTGKYYLQHYVGEKGSLAGLPESLRGRLEVGNDFAEPEVVWR